MALLNRMLSKSCICTSAVKFAINNFLVNFRSHEQLSDSLHSSSIHLFSLSLGLGLCCTDLVLIANPFSAEFLILIPVHKTPSSPWDKVSAVISYPGWVYSKILSLSVLLRICHSFPGSVNVLYYSTSLGNAYSRTQGFWKGNVFWSKMRARA